MSDREKIRNLMQWLTEKYPDIPNRTHQELGEKTKVYFVDWKYFSLSFGGFKVTYTYNSVDLDGVKQNFSEFDVSKFIRGFKQDAGKASAKKLREEKKAQIIELEQQLESLKGRIKEVKQ